MLEWSDPERAAQIIDAAPPLAANSSASEIEMLEIRAMIFADSNRDEDVNAIEQRLNVIAAAGDASALRAGRFARAYSARQHTQFAEAEAELKRIDMKPMMSDAERYRLVTLRGLVLRILGQDEASLPFLEQALDLANKMHDDTRTLHAMLSLARIYTDSGNFDRAMVQLDRRPRSGRPPRRRDRAWSRPRSAVADIADRRGDRDRGAARLARRSRARTAIGQQQMAAARAAESRGLLSEDPGLRRIAQVFQAGDADHPAHQSARQRADHAVQRRAGLHRSWQHQGRPETRRKRDHRIARRQRPVGRKGAAARIRGCARARGLLNDGDPGLPSLRRGQREVHDEHAAARVPGTVRAIRRRTQGA